MKNKILSIIFSFFIISVFIINIIIKDKDISLSERRNLAKFPKISVESIFNGEFKEDFEKYTLDQFMLRDEFRYLKSNVNYKILRKSDNNGYYLKDNHIFKMEYPINEKKVDSFINKMNNLYDNYLDGMNVYYTIVPDKNYYIKDNHLKMDYDSLEKKVNDGFNKDIKYISLFDTLSLDDYYYTDSHWRQEKIDKVVNKLSKSMNFKYDNNYQINKFSPFYGVYYKQAAINTKGEDLYYLTNKYINSATVKDSVSSLDRVYETESLNGGDSYDVFLSGATPLIEIVNNEISEGKELLMFRDSFSSSLAPLLLSGYKKITLIDLRYMFSSDLNKYIEFNNQDVLIIYNTTLINNSDTIRN